MISRRKAHIQKGELWKVTRMLFRDVKKTTRYLKEWEDTFTHYLGVKFAVAISSGRVGMELILKSLRLKKGDEIAMSEHHIQRVAQVLKDQLP